MADYDLLTRDLLAAAGDTDDMRRLRVASDRSGDPARDPQADSALWHSALRPTGRGWQLDPGRLLRQIQLVQAQTPPAGAAAPDINTQADAALLAHLDAIQSEAVRTQSCASFSTLVGMTLSAPVCDAKEIDRGCVALLARAFERLFRDRDLTPQTKVLVAPLQLPVLRAALLDRSFFLDPTHPARALLDAVLDATAGLSEHAPDDALCAEVDAVVRSLLAPTGDSNAQFARAQSRFARWIDARTAQRNTRLSKLIAMERSAEAQTFAQAEVDRRIQRRFELADIEEALANFLRGPWRQALIDRCLQRDLEPQAWQRALETTDALIWSVLPKSNSLERSELLRTLPALVQWIVGELDRIQWTGPERDDFMHFLMESHARVARTPPRSNAGRRATPPGLRDGDTRPADPSSSTVLDVVRLPESDAPCAGEWYLHQTGGNQITRLRLDWISPLRTRIILARHDGSHADVMAAGEVLSMLHAGTLRRMDAVRLVQHALSA